MKHPKYAKTNDSVTAAHSVTNPGAENSEYDVARHEKMRLRPLTQGNSFLIIGSKEPKPRCPICGKLESWCECEGS